MVPTSFADVSLLRTWWAKLEQAAKHVIAEDDIPETCKHIMDEFPFAALDLAITADSAEALLTMTLAGEVHVVDKMVQAKVMHGKLQESPNAVLCSDHHVQHLNREMARATTFFEKFLLKAFELHVSVIAEMDFKSDLITMKRGNMQGQNQIKCLWKLLKAWKAGSKLNQPGCRCLAIQSSLVWISISCEPEFSDCGLYS